MVQQKKNIKCIDMQCSRNKHTLLITVTYYKQQTYLSNKIAF